MVTRRTFLKSSVVGSTITLGSIATTSSATASGASFGDGVNLQPAYFCGGEQDLGWDLMSQHSDISTVRIEIEPPSWGEAHNDLTLSDVRRWIDEANANGYQVVATCHHWPNNGSGDTQDLQDAANWWANNYATLAQNSDFIINVHNEWGSHDTTRSTFASAYNNAISTIRSNTSYTGPLVIDIPGYGQEYQVAADAAGDINDSNVILSGHIYPSAWNSDKGRWVNTSDLDYLDNNAGGYPCIIGEFGSNMDGQADWSGLVDHAKSLGWPVLGWAWNGDGSSDPMNMTGPYWGDDCSATSYSKTSYFDTVYNKLDGGGGGGGSDDTSDLVDDCSDLNTLDGSSDTGSLTVDTSNSSYFERPDGTSDGGRITRSGTTADTNIVYAPGSDLADGTAEFHWHDSEGGDVVVEESTDGGSTWQSASTSWSSYGGTDASWHHEEISISFRSGADRVRFVLTGGSSAWSGQLGHVSLNYGSGSGDGTTTQTLEAENGTLDGVTTSTSRSGYSGSGYVTGFDNSGDSVTVSFDAAESGDRTLKIRYASEYDDKEANLSINGNSQGQVTLTQTSSFVETTLGTYSFTSGTNQITITKGWGYYDIDTFVVE